ncbi:hypothetical protein [Colwellia sp. MEBiC06753]
MNKLLAMFMAFAFTIVVPNAKADLLSDATKLGANTGAMAYCADKFGRDDDDRKKYNRLRLLSLKELDKLSGANKIKAIAVKKLAEDKGEYYGKKLDKSRCTSLRKTMSIVYLSRD